MPCPWLSAIAALNAPDKFTKKFSLGSIVESALIETLIVLLVCPGEKVNCPVIGV